MGLLRGVGFRVVLCVAALHLAACATMGDPPPTRLQQKQVQGPRGGDDSSRQCNQAEAQENAEQEEKNSGKNEQDCQPSPGRTAGACVFDPEG